MIETLKNLWESPVHHGNGLGLHGGEALMVKIRDLERLLKVIYQLCGETEPSPHTSIVTNASLITDSHIRLFKKYKTSVNISCDGPPELNILRGPDPSDPGKTSDYNDMVQNKIRRLKDEDIHVSIMCIIHTENAGDQEKLDRLKRWLNELKSIGITGGRINPMYAEPWSKQYELSNDQLAEAYRQMVDFTVDSGTRWYPFREMIDNICGLSCSPCIFGKCDVFKTNTLAILPDGTLTNCDRTFKYGIHSRSSDDMPKSEARYEILQLDQCAGCEYWTICGGGCPTEGEPDWRDKTRFCDAIYETYKHIEKKLTGLLPNIILVNNPRYSQYGDAFLPMSYAYCDRASTHGNYTIKDEIQQRFNQQNQRTSEGGGDPLPAHLDPALPWRKVAGGWYADSDWRSNSD
jgi:uncharacterized protein